MILTEVEMNQIKNLQTQEASCVEKYSRFTSEAHDPVLKELFSTIHQAEQKHYDSLGQVLGGTIPSCDCNDCKGKNYQPIASYTAMDNTKEKQCDAFLATDAIATEKLVSSELNSGVFVFNNSDIRKLLADIQIEEQNHAEMLWKYKTANSMQ